MSDGDTAPARRSQRAGRRNLTGVQPTVVKKIPSRIGSRKTRDYCPRCGAKWRACACPPLRDAP